MGILQTSNDLATLEYGRGDSFGSEITIKSKDGTATNIAGFGFVLTVDTELSPVDVSTNLFSVTGIITDAPNGKVEFSPLDTDTDLSEDTYFYDIQMTDTSSKKRTIIKAKFSIIQDISK